VTGGGSLVLEDCALCGNRNNGIVVGEVGSSVKAINCQVHGTTGSAFACWGGGVMDLSSCSILQNSAYGFMLLILAVE
jgi:hypothetical protein